MSIGRTFRPFQATRCRPTWSVPECPRSAAVRYGVEDKLRSHRTAEGVALRVAETERLQYGDLCGSLDSFGQARHAEILDQIDRGMNHRQHIAAGRQILHERLIDLDGIE